MASGSQVLCFASDPEAIRTVGRSGVGPRRVQQRVATRERRDEFLAGGEVDAELVGEVDDPLGRSAVVEASEVLADSDPVATPFVGSTHRGCEFPKATTELGVVRTVDQRLL